MHIKGKWQSKAALIFSVTINLLLLGFYKYWGFIVSNINYMFGTNIHFKGYSLPIGISFYTVQIISYVVDVYRNEVKAQESFFRLLLFISLYHQLVAGPIVRYKDIANEIEHRSVTPSMFSQGINRFAAGLGKKVIFANTSGEVAEFFLKSEISSLSVLGAWFGILMYALQIYYDFSGYSDMAIGLGKMFGFTYKENFNYPYISKSASEFWRRWHISLGSFFRDYVYIPLGGNAKNHIRNLLIVWLLTGLWHGASWNFVLWGLYYGLLIIMEKKLLADIIKKLPGLVSHAYLIVAILVGWVIFYYTNLVDALKFLRVMFGLGGNVLFDARLHIYFMNYSVFLAVALAACTPIVELLGCKLSRVPGSDRRNLILHEWVRPVVNAAIIVAAAILLVGKTYNPFLYFRF